MHQTIQEQTRIGWDEYRHGFLAKGWAELQVQYKSSITQKSNRNWNTMFTKIVIHFVYDTWKFCNEKVHGNNRKEACELRLQQLKQKAHDIHKKSKKYTITDKPTKQIFHNANKHLDKKTVTGLEMWIELAEQAIERLEENIRNKALVRWLNRTNNIQIR